MGLVLNLIINRKSKIMKYLLAYLLLLSAPVLAQNKAEQAIREVMRLQEEAWNKADLQGFMEGYWNSPELLFIGSKGVSKGWQTTLTNYQKSYPNAEAMGKLTFEIIKVELAGKREAWLVGKWSLQRTEDTLKGHFLLVWRKIKGKWYIIADHSS